MEQRPFPPSGNFNSELLTRREREILELLAQEHLTDRDIAEQLVLALNSVKWYNRQIYAKLGVNSRRQAIIRAREIGLIGDQLFSLPASHLPIPLTSFIGREKDIKNISQMITNPECRLITLTGTGGVGKTRLALKVGEENQARYPHGVWLVELSTLLQEHLVTERTAAVFNLLGNENRDPMRALKDFLKVSKLLLILDSCEHLINVCAKMVEYLLQNCPQLQIIATSQEALAIPGEIIYVVPPFDIQDLGKHPDLNQVIANDAVQLFVHRATLVKPTFQISHGNQEAVTYICNRLDGIPLALELAAARLKVLEVEQLAVYLETNFQILAGGGRTSPLRHRTITASIDWSYNLLSTEEQRLLQQLAVFNGGWTWEAAQSVCGNRSKEPDTNTAIIDITSQLVDKSLIVVTQKQPIHLGRSGENGSPGKYRYYMLGPIQQYAREKLRENGKEPDTLDRHLFYFLNLAEKVEPLFRGPDQVEWLNRFESEIDNFRIALAWALKTNVEAELRLGSALMWFWHIRGGWTEGLEWLLKGLNYPVGLAKSIPLNKSTNEYQINERVRAKSLSAAGYLQGNLLVHLSDSKAFDQVFALFQESLAIFRRQRPQDRSGIAFALLQLAQSAAEHLDSAEVIAWTNQSLALYREEQDWFGISECLHILAENERNPARAKEAFEEALKVKGRIKDVDGLAFTYADASSLCVFEGNYEQAAAYLLESLNCFQIVGNQSYMGRDLNRLAWVYWVKGDVNEALANIEKGLKLCQKDSFASIFAQSLLLRCEISLSIGNLEEGRQDVLEALSIAQDHNYQPLIVSAHQMEGKIAWLQGDDKAAIKSLETALAINRVENSQPAAAGLLYWLGRVKFSAGDLSIGKSLLLESVKRYIRLHLWHHWCYLAYPLEALASIAMVEQKFQRAARFYAIAQRIFPLLYNTLALKEILQREKEFQFIKKTLGEKEFHDYLQAELHTSMDQMVAYMLDNR